MHADALDEELLDHLVVEFGDRGQRAVEFLRTAAALLDAGLETAAPRLFASVTFCLREALKTIPEAHGPPGDAGRWRMTSREVTRAKQRFEQIRSLPGEDAEGALRDLLQSVDELALTHEQESIHQKRLIAAMMDRAGTRPLISGTDPINAYQDLVRRADRGLHNAVTRDEALDMWRQALGVLRQLFLPPLARYLVLAELAEIQHPDQSDVESLLSLVATPAHVHFFLAKVKDVDWLTKASAAGLVDPPRSDGVWPVTAAVDRLKDVEGERLAALLTMMFDKWGHDLNRAWHIARAAMDLGSHGQDLLLRACRKHSAGLAFASFVTQAARTADPESLFVRNAVDVVIANASRSGGDVYLPALLRTYTEGITAENHVDRIALLCHKLSRVYGQGSNRITSGLHLVGSVADPADFDQDAHFPSLIRALLDSLGRAAGFTTVADLLDVLAPLPDGLRVRVRSWILTNFGRGRSELMIDEVTEALGRRSPTEDDLHLVDRVVEQCPDEEYQQRWSIALGQPPDSTSVGRALSAREVPEAWMRSFYWTGVLPAAVTRAWTVVASILAGAYGQPTRAALEQRPNVEAGWGHSPISEEDLQALSPEAAAERIAAWQRDPSDWLAGSRELARALEAVVKANPGPWAATPVLIASRLREPVYISHYLRGLCTSDSLIGVGVEGLVELIQFCATHPWEPQALGDPGFDYDPTWEGVESAATDLVTALASQDIGFAGKDSEIWAFVLSQARDRADPGVDVDSDPMTQAINRRCTRALQAGFELMAYDSRAHQPVRPEVLDVLAETLALTGPDGLQHRAIIAPRLAFLRYVAPEWVDTHRLELLGPEAPENLGQATVDLAVSWGRPNLWLLGQFRDQARDAVARGISNALDHVLVAMLIGTPGYGVEDMATFLHSAGALSDAGEKLGRLLRTDDATPDHIALALLFWEQALAFNAADDAEGFGWYCEIRALDDAAWARLTRSTLTLTHGRISWARHVAERAARVTPSSDTLEILNLMVRGLSDSWESRTVLGIARDAMRSVEGTMSTTPEYQRLHTTILERGVE